MVGILEDGAGSSLPIPVHFISSLELKGTEVELPRPTVAVCLGGKAVLDARLSVPKRGHLGETRRMVVRKDAGVLKVHTSLQRAGRWPFHALSAGEFSQKPSDFTPFVPMSPLCPCRHS